MPIFKSKNTHVKIFCPNGTKYVTVQDRVIVDGIDAAFTAFEAEFGYAPRDEHVRIEINGVTAMWVISLQEIKE